MRKLINNFIAVLLILLIISGIFSLLSTVSEEPQQLSLSQLVTKINAGEVKSITVAGNKLRVTLADETKAVSRKEPEEPLAQVLKSYGAQSGQLQNIDVTVKNAQDVWSWLGPVLLVVLPFLLIGGVLWMMFQQARGGAMKAFDFTKTRARLFGGEDGNTLSETVSFDDVAGIEEAKEELMEVVSFLKEPQKFLQMGARIPRGVLLTGPPGCGKTLLARAIASEAGVPFFSISGSEFVELFVGVGSSRVRDLFQQAKRQQPALVFIDELDAIGRQRGGGFGGGTHEEREQTLNQILVEMDGFESESKVIVLGATNRPDVLDPALLRPGRFDRRIAIDLPDVEEREAILTIHGKEKPIEEETNLREIAERTPGFSGADLANLMNESALLAARRDKDVITQDELLESIEKVMLGPERKSHILTEEEKKIAAYHESGHALVGSLLPETQEPVRKISIVSRGMAAGYTLKMSTEEKNLKSKKEFIAEMAMLLGGYTAEKMQFKQITTGAANDLQKTSELARKLVKEYGMSKLGPVTFGEYGEMHIPKAIGGGGERNYSEKIAAQIDKEVENVVSQAQKKAERVLTKHKGVLEELASRLLEKETVEREEFEEIIGQTQKKRGKEKG